MFGYVKINKMDLTFREYEHYRGYIYKNYEIEVIKITL